MVLLSINIPSEGESLIFPRNDYTSIFKIQVDGQFRTSIPGIFAIGDVAAFPLKVRSSD